MYARENFTILRQIWPFLVANGLSARNAFRIRVLNYGMIFWLKSKHQNLMKYSKNVSTIPTRKADSFFHVIARVTLICL